MKMVCDHGYDGDVCRFCAAEKAQAKVSEQAKIPERCYYCDEQNCDHRHGSGSSCGDCCAMHGMLTAPEYKHGEYEWIGKCVKAKNERIAALTAERDEATVERDQWIECMRKVEDERDMLRAQVQRLSAPVTDEEMVEFAIHYIKVVLPDRTLPVLTQDSADRLLAARSKEALNG